ncbi:glutamic acid-rich protein-like [Dorcoceras hygrometricum]|uniref:Glutamic acid-rich protein-like n=1 Tax=Dorcoceras hygrometricum TaxID=472368 RepID=A0A2Z7A4E8_9LAMI|nr:glutamic acid-rich protein-like [Dorcoceras hygrometricum]
MASDLIKNASQIYFDSVFGMEDEGMVRMFKALESSGLRGFLGCSPAIYEAALVEFFQNDSVRDGKVISIVQGKAVEISEESFAGTFELPTKGLTEMADVPHDLVFDARTAFSFDGQHLKTSCKKREMKFEFWFLNDILAKIVTLKAGSFDAVTHERFLMMSAIHDLYSVEGCPDLELGDSKDFPPLKILSTKTMGTYVAKNKNISVEDVDDDPTLGKVVKKAASKRRPAPAVGEPVLKKKRTTVGKAAPSDKDLALLTVAQDVEPISTILAVTPRAPRRHAPKRKLAFPEGSDDEIVDSIIHHVIADTAAIETGEPDLEEPVIKETAEIAEKETDVTEPDVVEPVVVKITETVAIETENRIYVSSITNYDEEPVFRTAEEKEAEKQKEIEPVATEEMSLEKFTHSEDTEPLSKVLALTVNSKCDDESIPIDDLLAMIPTDMMLPSVTAEEPTKIRFGLGIEIPEVKEGDWYKASLPKIAATDKGKGPLVEKE